MMKIKNALAMIESAIPGLRGSPAYDDALKFLQRMSRHMSAGNPTAGVQQTQMQDVLKQIMQNALLSRIRQSQAQGGQGGPAGAMAQAPMPSVPLPGS
jgi:hypothetical protein